MGYIGHYGVTSQSKPFFRRVERTSSLVPGVTITSTPSSFIHPHPNEQLRPPNYLHPIQNRQPTMPFRIPPHNPQPPLLLHRVLPSPLLPLRKVLPVPVSRSSVTPSFCPKYGPHRDGPSRWQRIRCKSTRSEDGDRGCSVSPRYRSRSVHPLRTLVNHPRNELLHPHPA